MALVVIALGGILGCASSRPESSASGSLEPFLETDQPLQITPAMDRVADIVGQEGSVRFLEFREGAPEPVPGVSVGIEAFAFKDSRVTNKEWMAETHVEGTWFGVLGSKFTLHERPLLVVSSTDPASTWRIVGTVQPPASLGTVEALHFASPQRGCLVLTASDSEAAPSQSCSDDGGKTWSTFEQVNAPH